MSGPMQSLPGFIGRFRIEGMIGKGGMGVVYKAFDPSLDRFVALKTISPNAEGPSFLAHLQREARACGRLHHPRIVTVYDLGEIEGTVFIAMEYLAGENLARAATRGDLSFAERIDILIQILDALQFAHSEGVIHRDVKPSNVHLLPDRSVKLLDFGLARVTATGSLTVTDTIMGTPYYMSPEQLRGHPVDGRTDVYSTGVLAYELVTRRRPFEGEVTTVIGKVLQEPPPPMLTAWSHAFPEIERIVMRAIAKNVEDRYATAEEMRLALTAFLSASQTALATATKILPPVSTVAEVATERYPVVPADRPSSREAGGQLSSDSGDPTSLVALPALRPAEPAPRLATSKPPHSSGGAEAPSPASLRGRRARRRWLGAASAAAGFVIMALYWRAPLGLGDHAGGSVADVTTSADGPQPAGPATGTGTTGVSTGSPDSPQSAAPGSSVANGDPARSPVITNPTDTGRGKGQGRFDPLAVFIDAGKTDAPLRVELVNALQARGLAIVPTASRARVVLSAGTQISIRPSPFGNTSALTADYVATLNVHDVASGSRRTLQFDGHALEFGEAVVRTAAYRRAAEQMAEAVEMTVRS
jgi:serine/threonine protein kinase